jgi:hypothetical protein
VREYGDAIGCRVTHMIAKRASRRWKWLLKTLSVVEEKSARRNAIQRWIWSSMR